MGLYAQVLSRIRQNRQLNSLAQFLYLKAGLAFSRQPDAQDPLLFGRAGGEQRIKAAFVCDEMTWQDFKDCCDAVFLHPKTWRKQLEACRPSLFFCESAWSGIEAFPNVWRGRIYRDTRVSFENRDVLLDILDYCKENGIVTVFWNKEDPTFYEHPVYDFTDTALRFDYVFTTAQECIRRYQARDHRKTFLLPFGVNTDMFYPVPEKQKKNAAFFAGSWFGEFPKRCQELTVLLDYALEQNWTLDIYDRKSGAPEERFRFPEKYAPYLHPAVPFTQMPEICRQYEYALNVNTVVDSSTMISRRVLQLAASGATIVSNETRGFEALQDCLRVRHDAQLGLIFAEAIPGGVEKHSTASRFRYVLETVGLTPGENRENDLSE